MKHIKTYHVYPKLPGSLSFLGVLSRNMWWSWKPDAIELFRRVDPRLWKASGRNPIVFATQVSQERLQKLATDDSFIANLERVKQQWTIPRHPTVPKRASLISPWNSEFTKACPFLPVVWVCWPAITSNHHPTTDCPW